VLTLYTSYIGNRTIPADFVKLIIMRHMPFVISDQMTNMEHVLCLSPNAQILSQYKKDRDWDSFKISLLKQFTGDPACIQAMMSIAERLGRGEKICLLCCEKDYAHCHRYLVANMIVQHSDYHVVWEEWGEKKEKRGL